MLFDSGTSYSRHTNCKAQTIWFHISVQGCRLFPYCLRIPILIALSFSTCSIYSGSILLLRIRNSIQYIQSASNPIICKWRCNMTSLKCRSWTEALKRYYWKVDLTEFKYARNYPSSFKNIIEPSDIVMLESSFRVAIDEDGSFEIAGEICFWKNYGYERDRDRITKGILDYLKDKSNWNNFRQAVKRLSIAPGYENFVNLQEACNQLSGFATPITFLSFYNPCEYPMVDRYIADWWNRFRGKYWDAPSPTFMLDDNGQISTLTSQQRERNWNAYLSWTQFCREYANRISKNCNLNWRARDVEMATWVVRNNPTSLDSF